jgi:hypothetical protein
VASSSENPRTQGIADTGICTTALSHPLSVLTLPAASSDTSQSNQSNTPRNAQAFPRQPGGLEAAVVRQDGFGDVHFTELDNAGLYGTELNAISLQSNQITVAGRSHYSHFQASELCI